MICPYCKTNAPEGAEYCPRCQNRIARRAQPERNVGREKNRLAWIVGGIVVLAATLAGGIMLGKSLNGNGHKIASDIPETIEPTVNETAPIEHHVSYNYSEIDVGTEVRNGCFVIAVDVLGWRFGDKLNVDRQCEDQGEKWRLRKLMSEPGLPFTEMHLYALKTTREIYEISLHYQGNDYESVFTGLKESVKRQFAESEEERRSDNLVFAKMGGVEGPGSTIRITLGKNDVRKVVSLTFTDLALWEKMPSAFIQ